MFLEEFDSQRKVISGLIETPKGAETMPAVLGSLWCATSESRLPSVHGYNRRTSKHDKDQKKKGKFGWEKNRILTD